MNALDKVLLIHLAIEVVFEIFYLLWQFERIDFPEKTMQIIIAILNIFETVLLIMTRFMEYGSWGVFALGAWYIIITITLVMQFALADWGWRYKVQDVLWIGLYVHLFCIDIVHVNLISGLLSKYSPALRDFGEKINGTFWGDLLKAVVIAVVKGVVNIFATIKSDD